MRDERAGNLWRLVGTHSAHVLADLLNRGDVRHLARRDVVRELRDHIHGLLGQRVDLRHEQIDDQKAYEFLCHLGIRIGELYRLRHQVGDGSNKISWN